MALDVQTGGATRFKVIQTGGIYMPTLDTVSATALHIDGNGIISKASSSIRYKDNVTDIDFDTGRIFDVRPVSFQWKASGAKSFGLIAEEVDKVFPELVYRNKDGSPESVSYDLIGVLLVPELKKQQAEIGELKAENDNLREENSQLKSELSDIKSRLSALESKG